MRRLSPRWPARRLVVPALLLSLAACAGRRAPAPPSPEQIPALERRAERHPSDVDVLARLGAAYRQDGRLEQARTILASAHERAPRDPAAALFLGLTHEDLGEPGEAREVYSRYLEQEEPPLEERIRQRLELLRRQELQASIADAIEREDSLADRDPSPSTVAVLPFLYRSGDPEFRPLSRALAAFLVTDLSQTDRLQVVERLRVQLLLRELSLSDSEYVDPATAARSGHLLGAGRIVQGLMEGDTAALSVEAAAVDARSPPETMDPAFTGSGPPERIFELETELALGIYRSMGIELTPAQRERVAQQPTRNLRALLAFGRGLVDEDSAHFELAAEHYRRAAEIDPGFEEAEERAAAAEDVASALGTETGSLFERALVTLYPGAAGVAVFEPRRAVWETDLLAPTPIRRDPVAEVLGLEGLTSHPSEFLILVRPHLWQP